MRFRPVPHGRTARRLTWDFLPPDLRAAITRKFGEEVVDATSCDSGFTPGFASVLTGADGSKVFVKAASRKAQAPFASAYAEEARTRRLLGDVPAPQVLWTLDGGPEGWFAVGFEYVDGAAPARPWRREELDRCLDLAAEIHERTLEPPVDLRLAPLTDDLPRLVTGWEHVWRTRPDWPHLADAASLARRFDDLPAGFCHADLRDDNILLGRDAAWACDWNWPGLGPRAFDVVGLLLSADGDGIDADEVIAAHPFTRDFSDDEVDITLAAITGYMLESRDQPTVPSSPHLRDHGNAWAEAGWAWLARRRGWDVT